MQNQISGNMLAFLFNFLKNRKQWVFLLWKHFNRSVSQRIILVPLLFLVYVNYLYRGLSSKTNLFANDGLLFSVTHDINTSAKGLVNVIKTISKLTF